MKHPPLSSYDYLTREASLWRVRWGEKMPCYWNPHVVGPDFTPGASMASNTNMILQGYNPFGGGMDFVQRG